MYNRHNAAIAYIRGGQYYPEIRGVVSFNPMGQGTWVSAEIRGLPAFSREDNKSVGPHGFHIHEIGVCDKKIDFLSAGEHYNGEQYNPESNPCGNQAGDFPMLFSNHGNAKCEFFTDKFAPHKIIGKSVIIHEGPDDYNANPIGRAATSNMRIACGAVERA